MILRYVIAFILICAVGAWIATTFTGSVSQVAATSLALPKSTFVGPFAPPNTAVTTLEGTVLIDTVGGGKPVPYILYTNESGRRATKQLILSSGRGCHPSAGDLPCVPSITSSYPTLTDGSPIVVTGRMQNDRFIVETIRTP